MAFKQNASLQALLLGCAIAIASAQPFNFLAEQFQPAILEATQRSEDNYTGFVFDFNTATVNCHKPSQMLSYGLCHAFRSFLEIVFLEGPYDHALCGKEVCLT